MFRAGTTPNSGIIGNALNAEVHCLYLGTLSPNPWDLSLSRQNGSSACEAAVRRPKPIPAAESALRSHPCVAVSSAQVSPV